MDFEAFAEGEELSRAEVGREVGRVPPEGEDRRSDVVGRLPRADKGLCRFAAEAPVTGLAGESST